MISFENSLANSLSVMDASREYHQAETGVHTDIYVRQASVGVWEEV